MKKMCVFLMLVANIAFAEDKAAQENNSKNKTKADDSEIVLQSTFVGDKEQPAVSYFVPWKGSESPDKLRWNREPKNDQALDIVDREVMVNSMTIYDEMDLESQSLTK
jgi:hypothetical protein